MDGDEGATGAERFGVISWMCPHPTPPHPTSTTSVVTAQRFVLLVAALTHCAEQRPHSACLPLGARYHKRNLEGVTPPSSNSATLPGPAPSWFELRRSRVSAPCLSIMECMAESCDQLWNSGLKQLTFNINGKYFYFFNSVWWRWRNSLIFPINVL